MVARSPRFVAVAVLVVLAFVLWPVSVWPALAAVTAVSFVVARTRLDTAASAASAVTVTLGTLFAAALLAPRVGTHLHPTAWAACAAVATGGLAWWVRLSAKSQARTGTRERNALALLIAPGLWAGALAVAKVLPGAAPHSWAMLGDSTPHTLLAMAISANEGVTSQSLVADPVPLVHVLMAVVGGADGGYSIATAIGATIQTWAVLVGVSAIFAGLAARRVALAVGADDAWSWMAGTLASLVVITGFVTGSALKFGFINSHLVLIVVFVIVIAITEMAARPWWSVAILASATVALLATWSPLAVLPVAAGAVAVARLLVARRALARPVWWILGCVGAGAVAYVGLYQVPLLSRASASLAIDGGLMPLPPIVLPVLVVVLLALLWLARRVDPWFFRGMAAFSAAMLAGLVATVALAHNPWWGPWTYYPVKYAWQMSSVVLPLMLGAAGIVASRGSRLRAATSFAMVAAVIGLLGAATAIPSDRVRFVATSPLTSILQGTAYGAGDDVYLKVLAATSSDRLVVLWATDDERELLVNHWTFQWESVSRPEPAKQTLFLASHFLREPTMVCDVVHAAPDVVVLTGSPEFKSGLLEVCPDATVVVDTWTAERLTKWVSEGSRASG